MVVRDNKAAAAPVTAILITSKCVEHQLFFDPFVMISIQPVRTLQIQNSFCRISRYCVTVSLTKHSAESCISNLLPHVRICLTVSTWAAYCFSKVPYLCVCVSDGWRRCVRWSFPYSWVAAGWFLSAPFSFVALCCHHNTVAIWPAALSQCAFNIRRPMTSRGWGELWTQLGKRGEEEEEGEREGGWEDMRR